MAELLFEDERQDITETDVTQADSLVVDELAQADSPGVDELAQADSPGVDELAQADSPDVDELLQADELEADEATSGQTDSPDASEVLGAPEQAEWYVIHCYSGYENKVKHNLEQRIESMNMRNQIFQVVVPTEEEIEVRDGKRRTVERRVFPGYILVQMLMDEESWYVVRNTPGVTGFVGMGNKPTALRPEEVQGILKRMQAEAPKVKVTFMPGQKVRIIDGPFNDFMGMVDEIDMDKAKVRVMVSFFGRETPVELDFLQVEKM
ncbi:MAG: transcription termination/antitermination protein NusG [Thermoflexales bacterium]|nr:transcription termination/antitermination protein NusG [Thermoflexales bacterium]